MMTSKKLTFTLLSSLFFYSASGYSIERDSIKNTYQEFTHNLEETWNKPDSKDLYLPFLAWHNRYAYDDEHLKRYNEKPWGLGGGVTRYDEKENWNGIYFMVFKDSFNKWEPIGGYGWEKIWHPVKNNKDFRLGTGYTAFITLREQWNYIPVPGILPLASVGYKDLTVQATYIPGVRNNGNVLFCWLKFSF